MTRLESERVWSSPFDAGRGCPGSARDRLFTTFPQRMSIATVTRSEIGQEDPRVEFPVPDVERTRQAQRATDCVNSFGG